jgi:hypothetical protein
MILIYIPRLVILIRANYSHLVVASFHCRTCCGEILVLESAVFARAAALPAARVLARWLAAAAGASKKSGEKGRSKRLQSLMLCIVTPR